MPQTAERVGPIRGSERIAFIDVVRGIALFGILAANMRAFFAPIDCYLEIGVLYHSRADVIAQWFIDAFIQGKFISIFSFLFGMGFAIQFSRAEARGVKFLSFYPRRLLALAFFGLIHGIVFWAGDILLTYSLAGALMLFFRKRSQKVVVRWAVGLLAAPFVAASVFVVLYLAGVRGKWMMPEPQDLQKLQAVIQIYSHGTPAQILAQNWVEWKQELRTVSFAVYALGLFLLGLWTWRAGIVQKLEEYRPVLKRVCFWGIGVGLVMNVYVATVEALVPLGTLSLWRISAATLLYPSGQVLAAGYVSGLALLFLDEGWRQRLLPFAAVGRMALSNYLLETLVCTLFFYSYTTGLYGRIGPALGLIPTVIVYGLQVVFSNWWMNRFNFGPLEWVWRAMTYLSFPPMRKGSVSHLIEV